MRSNTWLVTLAAVNLCCAYKIAIFVPDVSNSQVIWNVRVAETLADAGHKITLIRIKSIAMKKNELPIRKDIEEWRYQPIENLDEHAMEKIMPTVFKDLPMWSSEVRRMFSVLGGSISASCEGMLKNKEFLTRLREAKFDLAFASMDGLCTPGLIHYAKIPAWIFMNNAPLIDVIAHYVGVPSPPSYVPPIASYASDEMSFSQRVKSFIGWTISPIIFSRLVTAPETAMFRKYIDPNFPDLADIVRECPLLMVNSNEMYSLPRPILHKIVYIGGLGMNLEASKPLTGEFKEIVDKASNVIIFSFGSVTNSSMMPQEWKDSLMASFRRFPNVEFIMRYVGDDLDDKRPANVHFFKWIPQTDLMHNEKTRALITHSGFNSVQESINSGTPIIAIPLYGDQFANAKLAEKHRFGIILEKRNINEESISAAIQKMLNDKIYSQSAERMREMIRKKPTKPAELLVRWTEFVAEFHTLPNLTPYGIYLSFIQYYCIDVIVFLFAIILLVFFIIYKILSVVLRLSYSKIFSKKQKTA